MIQTVALLRQRTDTLYEEDNLGTNKNYQPLDVLTRLRLIGIDDFRE